MIPERAREIADDFSPIGWEDTITKAILAAVAEDRAARVALPDADRERLADFRYRLKNGHVWDSEVVAWLLDLAENLSAVLSDLLHDKGVDLLIAAAVRRERERCERLAEEWGAGRARPNDRSIHALEWDRRYGRPLTEAIRDGC